jgi:hypothetical protein
LHAENVVSGIEKCLAVGEPQIREAGILNYPENDQVVYIHKVAQGGDNNNHVQQFV